LLMAGYAPVELTTRPSTKSRKAGLQELPSTEKKNMNELNHIFKYREMLSTTIQKELRARYKGSVLGFLWTFVNPLLQLAVYSLAFRYILRVRVAGINYTIFLFVGLVTWTCFSSSLIMGSSVIAGNGTLIKKIYFPRVLLPVSSVLGNIINFLFTLCVLLPVLWFQGYLPNIYYLYLPLLILLQAILNLGFVLILSASYVYFRDIEHILGVVLMAWMYVTPVFYSVDYIPGSMYHFLKLNPMFVLVTAYQNIFLFSVPPNLVALLYLTTFSCCLLFGGYLIFNSLQRRFAEEL